MHQRVNLEFSPKATFQRRKFSRGEFVSASVNLWLFNPFRYINGLTLNFLLRRPSKGESSQEVNLTAEKPCLHLCPFFLLWFSSASMSEIFFSFGPHLIIKLLQLPLWQVLQLNFLYFRYGCRVYSRWSFLWIKPLAGDAIYTSDLVKMT